MSERLSDVNARISSVRQLSAVITAMRGIAAARSREARGRLEGIRTYAETIADAIGHVLAVLPEEERTVPGHHREGGHAVIALGAEQGFAGVFSERVLDAAVPLLKGAAELLLVGDRALMVARERGLEAGWSVPMVAHVGQAAALADRISEELYRRIDAGEVRRVTIVHAVPGASAAIETVTKVLVPFDFTRFPLARVAAPPLMTLPPRRLLAQLSEEYVFAELCEAITLSFAAENEARMRAMIAARSNVADTLETLVGRARQMRQEEITNEIIELVGGTGGARRKHHASGP